MKTKEHNESVIGLSGSSVIAENGAHVDDMHFAECVYKNGCPYDYCHKDCILYELHNMGKELFPMLEKIEFLPSERKNDSDEFILSCQEAADVFSGGRCSGKRR